MRKIIIAAILIITTHTPYNVCMETNKKPSWNIFGYLNMHNSPFNHTINMCDEVENLINAGADVNKKEISMMSRFYGSTPLEVAITESKCDRCIKLLRQNGARETLLTIALLENNKKNTHPDEKK